jgi:hypothetical protein
MSYSFKNAHVECIARVVGDEIHLTGKFNDLDQYDTAEILAANPIDRMTNYSGSGLPFPCAAIAFDMTPNYTILTDKSGVFSVLFSYPNSYYTEDGFTKIPPSIFFILRSASRDPVFVKFSLPYQDSILHVRTLGYRPKHSMGPAYYAMKEDVMGIPSSAEATMRAYKSLKINDDLS